MKADLMKEKCAFCPSTAKLSGEHVISNWINALLPGKKVLRLYNQAGRAATWSSNEMDYRANVVCKECNETWMSDIEARHAKPRLTPLILSNKETLIPIDLDYARSIALFAFKTAVILDHLNRRGEEPFFSKRLRYAFRENLFIPPDVAIWMFAYRGRNPSLIRASYHNGYLSPTYPVQSYTCSCTIGEFGFQLLSVKQLGNVGLKCNSGLENMIVSLWPRQPFGLAWPPELGLQTRSEFYRLAERWGGVWHDPV